MTRVSEPELFLYVNLRGYDVIQYTVGLIYIRSVEDLLYYKYNR